ncbi:VPS10 domain-containing receptor SorCS2 [Pteropus alecto]|uniref:VPS10 domain-containing receptor SorCS2 n=1 Tax=Pteropus alecto TaxID=9402 RepID=L5K6Y2_PTEAL|nr:VPS10 domain-containing receptor SorCS2 [Pteropus alecto]
MNTYSVPSRPLAQLPRAALDPLLVSAAPASPEATPNANPFGSCPHGSPRAAMTPGWPTWPASSPHFLFWKHTHRLWVPEGPSSACTWAWLQPPKAGFLWSRLVLHCTYEDQGASRVVTAGLPLPDDAGWLCGNLGSQLVEYKEEMYITSDCGHTWRQVFEEEHHVLYLDHGGVIVAIKDTSIPLKILNIFGHISFRSDWELVKVDFRPSFSRPCGEEDYSSWDLTDLQGDRCLMGQQRSFRKRKPASWCTKGRSFTSALRTHVCECRASDFLCDYGFERSPSSESDAGQCFANFWFNPLSPPDDCVLGQTYANSLG